MGKFLTEMKPLKKSMGENVEIKNYVEYLLTHNELHFHIFTIIQNTDTCQKWFRLLKNWVCF